MLPIITISREFGSGGHSIAEKVAKVLNIPIYDSSIVEKVAKESGYAKTFIEDKGEYSSIFSKWFASSAISPSNINTPQDQIFTFQSEILLDYMRQGPCIIVGRCADYICEINDIPALNVFIHANVDARKERIMKRFNMEDEATVEKLLSKKDKGRTAYYRYYTDREWGDASNYELSLDSSRLGDDLCAEIIAHAAQVMAK